MTRNVLHPAQTPQDLGLRVPNLEGNIGLGVRGLLVPAFWQIF